MKRLLISLLCLATIISVPFGAQAKKSYDSFSSALDSYYDYEGLALKKDATEDWARTSEECCICKYGYYKIKTPYKNKRAMLVEYGATHYRFTDIYIKDNNNRVIKLNTLKGSVIRCTKSRKFLITEEYLPTGQDIYRVYKYNKNLKKYKSYGKYAFKYLTDSQKKAKIKVGKRVKTNFSKLKRIKIRKALYDI